MLINHIRVQTHAYTSTHTEPCNKHKLSNKYQFSWKIINLSFALFLSLPIIIYYNTRRLYTFVYTSYMIYTSISTQSIFLLLAIELVYVHGAYVYVQSAVHLCIIHLFFQRVIIIIILKCYDMLNDCMWCKMSKWCEERKKCFPSNMYSRSMCLMFIWVFADLCAYMVHIIFW